MQYLTEIFGNRILSNERQETRRILHQDWPPYSPDLNPLDYFFWSAVRVVLYQNRPKTKPELKQALKEVIPRINLNHVKDAIDDFRHRIECLRENKGEHFEYAFKAFKVRRFRREEKFCDACEKYHFCACDGCKQRCLENILQRMNLNIPTEDSDSTVFEDIPDDMALGDESGSEDELADLDID